MFEELRQWKDRRVVVLMSGGVDSAVAAALLHRAGAQVIGVHMRVWHYEGQDCKTGSCCTPSDARDARRVADLFGFPFYAMDFEADFRRSVIEPFIEDYLAGRTPIPCVHCNNELKLGTMIAKAAAYEAEAVATGHYARIREGAGGRHELLRAADHEKDQTYFLFGLKQDQLGKLQMPLGGLTKTDTRQLARELGIGISEKPDSYEICFVADNDYRRFLREEAGLDEEKLSGAIVDTAGEVIGRHAGIHNFTIGQRKGIGLAAEAPLYVVDLMPETQTVVVGRAHEVSSAGLEMERFNWVSVAPRTEPFRALCRIRHRNEPAAATVYPIATEEHVAHRIAAANATTGGTESGSILNASTGRLRVIFDEPARAVAPGQACVCYDEADPDRVLGGGWIARRLSEAPQLNRAAEIA